MRLLPIPFMILINISLLAQGNVFTYSKNDHVIIFKSDTAHITFNSPTKTKSGSVEQLVRVNNRRYTFTTKKTNAGKIQTITDSSGRLQATVFLYGDSRYNLLLTNGEFLKWSRKDKIHWAYQRNGKDVITGSYKKVDNENQITVQSIDPSVALPEITAIVFLEAAEQTIGSPLSTGAMIGIAIGLGFLRFATSSGLN